MVMANDDSHVHAGCSSDALIWLTVSVIMEEERCDEYCERGHSCDIVFADCRDYERGTKYFLWI